MLRNVLLLEAVGDESPIDNAVKSIKKLMNTCKLTKYKSEAQCAEFFSIFFLCSPAASAGSEEVAFVDWCMIYNVLLSDDKFCQDLCSYMAMYQPREYVGMWNSLIRLIDSELERIRDNRLRYLSEAKAFFKAMYRVFDGIGETIKAQIIDAESVKFITTVLGVLNTHTYYITRLIQREMAETDPNDIVMVNYVAPLEEDVKEILWLLEHGEEEIAKSLGPVNEAILSNAAMAAKTAKVKADKAGRNFEMFVMKQVKAAREKRRNRKHAEMVGEALRINNEIKRLLLSLGVGMLAPALGVILWVTSVVIDRKTDKRDREILVGQIKDELEIVEEKISIAERNGDDKAKIELIRIRQRLQKEYGRIQKYRWDPDRANNNRG